MVATIPEPLQPSPRPCAPPFLLPADRCPEARCGTAAGPFLHPRTAAPQARSCEAPDQRGSQHLVPPPPAGVLCGEPVVAWPVTASPHKTLAVTGQATSKGKPPASGKHQQVAAAAITAPVTAVTAPITAVASPVSASTGRARRRAGGTRERARPRGRAKEAAGARDERKRGAVGAQSAGPASASATAAERLLPGWAGGSKLSEGCANLLTLLRARVTVQ